MNRRGGSSLASTLLVAALVLTLALTVAGVSVSHLSLGARQSNNQQTRNLAEAALALCLERLTADSKFGSQGTAEQKTVRVEFPGAPGGVGLLTFDQATADQEHIPRSTYNLRTDSHTTGYGGRIVPKDSVHLAGVGRYNGVEQGFEVILYRPTYPFALASAGPLSAIGELLVASATDTESILPAAEDHLDELKPGHVAANGALDLYGIPGRITVTGSARSTSTITRDDASRVEIREGDRPGSSQIPVPDLDLAEFDPARLGATQDPAGGPGDATLGDLSLSGLIRHRGNLEMDRLRLAPNGGGAIVWVDGDVTIHEGIVGTGLVVATGNLTIEDRSITDGSGQVMDLKSDNTAALLAGGNLDVSGQDSNASFFRGLCLAKGKLNLRDITVVGPVVKAGDAGEALTLERANTVQVDEVLDFRFEMPFQGGDGNAPLYGDVRLGPKPGGGVYKLADFYDPDSDHYNKTVGPEHLGFWKLEQANEKDYQLGRAQDFYTLDEAVERAAAVDPPGIRKPGTQQDFASWDEVFAYYNIDGASRQDKVRSYLETVVLQRNVQERNQELARIDDFYQRNQGQPRGEGRISLDPNRFLPLSQAVRVLLWQPL